MNRTVFPSICSHIKIAGKPHFHRDSQHHLRCQINEVQFQHLRDEGETTGGTQITLDDQNIVVTRHKLNVERSVDV